MKWRFAVCLVLATVNGRARRGACMLPVGSPHRPEEVHADDSPRCVFPVCARRRGLGALSLRICGVVAGRDPLVGAGGSMVYPKPARLGGASRSAARGIV